VDGVTTGEEGVEEAEMIVHGSVDGEGKDCGDCDCDSRVTISGMKICGAGERGRC